MRDQHVPKSLFAVLTPYQTDTDSLPNPMPFLGSDNRSSSMHNPDGATYHGQSHTRAFWSLPDSMNPIPGEPHFEQHSRYNTRCYQGHQTMWNPVSKTFDLTYVHLLLRLAARRLV